MEEEMNRYLVVTIACWIVIVGWVFESMGREIIKVVPAEEMSQTITAPNVTLSLQLSEPRNEMKITSDGHIYFNGTSIEKMNVPEIREVMVKILEEMQRANQQEKTNNYLFRQTDHLLMELEKCKEGK